MKNYWILIERAKDEACIKPMGKQENPSWLLTANKFNNEDEVRQVYSTQAKEMDYKILEIKVDESCYEN